MPWKVATRGRCLGPALLVMLAGCAPALNWRELRPADSGLLAMFPCKADAHARDVQLAGAKVKMTLYACNAAELTWAVAFADVAGPAAVAPALQALRQSAGANLGAPEGAASLPLAVPGATPNPQSQRVQWRGRLPDGAPVQAQTAVFVKGTRVFQATVLGPQLPAEAVDNFFAGLKLPA